MLEPHPHIHKDPDYGYIHKIEFLKISLILKVLKYNIVKKKRKLNKHISKEIVNVYERINFLIFNLVIQNVPVSIQ